LDSANKIHVLRYSSRRWLLALVLLVPALGTLSCSEKASIEVATPATLTVNVTQEGEPLNAILSLRSRSYDYEVKVAFSSPGSIVLPIPDREITASIGLSHDDRRDDSFRISPDGHGSEYFAVGPGDHLEIDVEFGTGILAIRLPEGQEIDNPAAHIRLDREGVNYSFNPLIGVEDGVVYATMPNVLEGTYEVADFSFSGFSTSSRCDLDSIQVRFGETSHVTIPEARTLKGRLILPWTIEEWSQVTTEAHDELTTYPLHWNGPTAEFEIPVQCFELVSLWFPHPDSAGARKINYYPNYSDSESLLAEWEFGGLVISIETDDHDNPFHLFTEDAFDDEAYSRTGPGVARLLCDAGSSKSLFYESFERGIGPPRQRWIDPVSERGYFDIEAAATRSFTWEIHPGGTVSGSLSRPLEEGESIYVRSAVGGPKSWPAELDEARRDFQLHHVPSGEIAISRATGFSRGNEWFYPGTFNYSDREKIDIEPGESISGIDF